MLWKEKTENKVLYFIYYLYIFIYKYKFTYKYYVLCIIYNYIYILCLFIYYLYIAGLYYWDLVFVDGLQDQAFSSTPSYFILTHYVVSAGGSFEEQFDPRC